MLAPKSIYLTHRKHRLAQETATPHLTAVLLPAIAKAIAAGPATPIAPHKRNVVLLSVQELLNNEMHK